MRFRDLFWITLLLFSVHLVNGQTDVIGGSAGGVIGVVVFLLFCCCIIGAASSCCDSSSSSRRTTRIVPVAPAVNQAPNYSVPATTPGGYPQQYPLYGYRPSVPNRSINPTEASPPQPNAEKYDSPPPPYSEAAVLYPPNGTNRASMSTSRETENQVSTIGGHSVSTTTRRQQSVNVETSFPGNVQSEENDETDLEVITDGGTTSTRMTTRQSTTLTLSN